MQVSARSWVVFLLEERPQTGYVFVSVVIGCEVILLLFFFTFTITASLSWPVKQQCSCKERNAKQGRRDN